MPDRTTAFPLGLVGAHRYYRPALYGLWAFCLIGWLVVLLVPQNFTVEARILSGSGSAVSDRPAPAIVTPPILAELAKRLAPSASAAERLGIQDRLSLGLRVSSAPGEVVVLRLRDADPQWGKIALSALLDQLAVSNSQTGLLVQAQPSVVERPELPGRAYLSGAVFGLAIVTTVCLVLGWSMARPTIQSAADLSELTGLPVLGSVPVNWENEALRTLDRRERFRLVAGLAGLGLIFVLVLVLETSGFEHERAFLPESGVKP